MTKNKDKNNNNSEKKVGAFVGKFLPPHIGHLSVIDNALKECDKLYIVISDDAKNSKKLCKKNNFPYFSAKTRLKWFKKHYKTQKNASFRIIDESKLKDKNNKSEYAKLFFDSVGTDVNIKYADESYRELNEKYFPNSKFVAIDRDKINIHSTNIREDLNNIKFVIKEAQNDILKALKKIKN